MAANQGRGLSATFVPGGFDDYYYVPPAAAVLVAPEPQRINPEMSNQIQNGMHHMNIDGTGPNAAQTHNYSDIPMARDTPHLTPFPKIANPPPNVPPSDEELEATLENARTLVLNSNDPEMQLAWASDALVYVGVCADNEDRIAAAKPPAARAASPRIEHQLRMDAMNIVTFLADQHHPKAEFLRGMWLEWGRFGQREDKKEAFRCYSRAADRGYVRAEYRIGMLYESYNDPIKALRHYHRGVDTGDAACCYRLGMMTLRGQHGQPQDFAKGIDLIKRSAQAADENAAQGAYVYGSLLARQLPQIEVPEGFLPLDERLARINIEKAAYLKFAKAQLRMGSAYELGNLGCEFNPALSMHYNALASKQGEPEADMALSKWFLVGSEGLFPKNEELAFTYAERAAQSGLATAEFALGYFSEIGMYVPVDLEKALDWYQKASKHGNEDARGRVDGLSRKQVLSRKDHENVAITRIKSQYGSQRGARPERFQQRQQTSSRLGQSVIAEEPEPGYGNGTPALASGMRFSSGGVQAPSRDSSTTPYPMDNRPPIVAPVDSRPGSVAPYPLEDGPPSQKPTPRLGPAGGFFNVQQPLRPATTVHPDMRPSSAFQVNPELRSSSAMTVPQLPPQGGRPYPYPPATSVPVSRPMSAQPQQPFDPRLRPGAVQRIASGPASIQNFAPSKPGPPGPSASPRPGMMQHQATAPAAPQQAQQPGRLDIGFSAPQDDRRNRTYGPQPGAGKPASPTALQGSGSMPNFAQALPAQPSMGRISAPSSRPGSRPPDGQRKPLPPPSSGAVPRPLQKDMSVPPPPPPQSVTPKPNTQTSTGPPAAAAKPAGKVPKTFDEMGVPAQKTESDCVMM
ncbi:hypothetical protein LTR36_007598 [Oleoguttula mirabilis]|uniref:HCP-like protein n=1 Tax=Oleoguttula mirabilis TaxID=1507867 RepID=A0AAV9JVQ4_9PEZI|nr:hypothetical protein LTR36_007598 [Oleoguttula mirabilis]